MREIGLLILYSLTSYDDIKTKEVSMLKLLIFAVVAIILDVVCPNKNIYSILGGLTIGLALYFLSVITNEKIGKGDALIIGVTGLYLGYMDTLILLWISSVLALMFGVIRIKKLKVDVDYEMPFIPFLLIGFSIMCIIHLWRSICL